MAIDGNGKLINDNKSVYDMTSGELFSVLDNRPAWSTESRNEACRVLVKRLYKKHPELFE